MSKPVRADRRGLRLRGVDDSDAAVDVYFDGHRVWSTKLPDANPRTGTRQARWPAAMLPYLRGTTTLSVRASATGQELAGNDVRFGGAAGRVSITDAQDRWLAINKWNRFGPSFEGDSSGVQDRLLKAAAVLADQLHGWGYPAYIVGGSLLGAMRSGTLLPHDDDIDFAFWCDRSDPQDVSLVSFGLQRQLEGLHYTVVRHSHAHLEIVYFADDGGTDFYIDVFTGYHSEDGLYNQPFALRGPLPREELLPVQQLDVGGVMLPAPAVPESWLAYAYGPNWRVPDPSFRWETPRATLRRFENSFGVFNRQRVFWEKKWQEVDAPAACDTADAADTDRFLRLLPEHSFVVDLGCGDGRHAERIAAAGHRVLGVEYSYEALRVARGGGSDSVEYRFLNLNDRHGLLEFALDLVDRGVQPYFFARNLLHELPQLGRADLFVALHGLLDDQHFLYATFDATPVTRIPTNPETWNVALGTLRTEAWRWKLGVTVLADRRRRTPYGARTNLTALVWT